MVTTEGKSRETGASRPSSWRSHSILVADDEPRILREYADYLENRFGKVYTALNGAQALDLWKKELPDMLLLDLTMPEKNGVDVVREVRSVDETIPIMILTGNADQKNLLSLVELNIQRFLQKPVSPLQFKEALQYCVCRLEGGREDGEELCGSIHFDKKNSMIRINGGEEIALTRQERLFMELLVRHRNRIVTYPEIESYVWGHRTMTENALKALVRNLRRKVPKELFRNHKGQGYKIGE